MCIGCFAAITKLGSKEVQMDKMSIALTTNEDELWGVEKVRLALSTAGFKVLAMKNWQAPEVTRQTNPDLIIANLAGDHPEDLRLCRLLASTNQAPLIVIGSPIQTNQVLEMFEAGITDYLVRPVNLRELVARVRNILYRSQPPFQFDETAVFSDNPIAITHSGNFSLKETLRSLVGRLVRTLPPRGL
jgi:DNA-binding response OmpR family regulator